MNGIILGILIPFLGTVAGSAFVFFMRREMNAVVQKAMLGFASGVMVAASVWSLLIPALEFGGEANSAPQLLPAAVGFLAGMAFLLLIDYATPHLHIGTSKPEGPRSHLSRTAMLMLAVTIHNLPEGMAVGVVLAGAADGGMGISTAAALAMSVGIAIQNVPEGAIVSMPMRAAGNSRWRSFLIGSLSDLLAFAAGAMLYVVIEELIPEASTGEHSNLGTVGFAIGFTLMMTLDVVLG